MVMLLLFALCTLLNVVLATIKSVMTIKGSKISAAVWNALSFGLYSYIVILTATADLTTIEKIAVTVVCNLIGVYGVKWVEEKMRKDRLWKVEMTVRKENAEALCKALSKAGISNYYVPVGNHVVFNCFCNTKAETELATSCGNTYSAKMFANETTLAP